MIEQVRVHIWKILLGSALLWFVACNGLGKNPKKASPPPGSDNLSSGSYHSITSDELVVFRHCKSSANMRFVVCERYHYKGRIKNPASVAEYFDIVVIDEQTGNERTVKDSRGGSEPSITDSGRVAFRKGDSLVIEADAGKPPIHIILKDEFDIFMQPMISSDGSMVAVMGNRKGATKDGVSIIFVSDRSIRDVPRRCYKNAEVLGIEWLDAKSLMITMRERSKRGRLEWLRALRFNVDSGSCSLVYFADLEDEVSAISARFGLVASVVSGTNDAREVVIRSFSGDELGRVALDREDGTRCIDDFVILASKRSMLMSCKVGNGDGYNLTSIEWRVER